MPAKPEAGHSLRSNATIQTSFARNRPCPPFAPRTGNLLQSLPLHPAPTGAIAVEPVFPNVRQFGHLTAVMNVVGHDAGAMDETGLAVRADGQLHAKVPLVAFHGLVHLGLARPLSSVKSTRVLEEVGRSQNTTQTPLMLDSIINDTEGIIIVSKPYNQSAQWCSIGA